MTNEEIDAYIAKIEELYAYAVAHSLVEGSDCTGMLVNPMFTEADGKGWKWDTNDNETKLAMRGGNAEFYCAEAYAGFNNNAGFLFDVHQEVADVPDGIYEISANCFYRWADNGQFTGEEVVPAVIYMNDFESPVQHIASNAVPYDQIMTTDEGGKDVLQEGWYGEWANNEGIGYVPNDMNAASCAFKKDMYKQTVYGLVEGGKMRIGIKKETKTEENRHWCLWTNFRLTFMGQNEDAVASIVESLSANLEALLQTEVAAALSDEMISEAEDLIGKAGNLSGEENYQLMKDLNAMVKKVKAVAAGNKEAMAELQKVYDAANAAMETDEYANDENYTIIVDDIVGWQAQMLEKVELGTLTDEERAEIMEKADEYVARLGIRGDWTKATEEAPVDMTSLIVNADFSTGNINGWTDTFTEGNHGFQNNRVYGDNTSEDGAYCDKFVEAWRAGSAALGSGSISQTIGELPYSFLAALPAGNYVLKADMNVQNQIAQMTAEQRGRVAVTLMTTGMYLVEGSGSGGGFNTTNALNAFLQSQIAGIAGKALNTIDLSLGVSNNATGRGTTTTDYSFRFAKRFWGNRVSLIVGGKVSSGSDAVNTGQSIIDNVSIEYRLDKSGTRYVTLFYDNNYESVLEGEVLEMGVGLVLRRKTNRLGELFIFRKK